VRVLRKFLLHKRKGLTLGSFNAEGVSHGTPCSPSFTQCVYEKNLPGVTAGHFPEKAPCRRAQGWSRWVLPEAWLVSGGSVGHARFKYRAPQTTRITCNNPASCMRHMSSQWPGLTGSSGLAMEFLRPILSHTCLVYPILAHSQKTRRTTKNHMLVHYKTFFHAYTYLSIYLSILLDL
jgi:hypothetical protein